MNKIPYRQVYGQTVFPSWILLESDLQLRHALVTELYLLLRLSVYLFRHRTPRIDYWLNTQSQIALSGLEPPLIIDVCSPN